MSDSYSATSGFATPLHRARESDAIAEGRSAAPTTELVSTIFFFFGRDRIDIVEFPAKRRRPAFMSSPITPRADR